MAKPGQGPADWDAESYARVATPQREWSAAVLDRLRLNGDETVLDAGCGSGEVTADLLDRLPGGNVIGIDSSPGMIEAARHRLGSDPRATFQCQDLTRLKLADPVDAVFSNAAFHWIHDHDRLFRSLAEATRAGGRLVGQCGGSGNVREVVAAIRVVNAQAPFDEAFAGLRDPWNFAGPEETGARLVAAGYEEVECWLEKRTARPEDPRSFFEASSLSFARKVLDEGQFDRYTERLWSELGNPESFNYVRLNMTAKRKDENE